MQKVEMCYCGRPLHYTDEKIRLQVEEIIKRFGPLISVKVDGGKTFSVPRHYIALHGIRAKDLAALGFKEVKNENT